MILEALGANYRGVKKKEGKKERKEEEDSAKGCY